MEVGHILFYVPNKWKKWDYFHCTFEISSLISMFQAFKIDNAFCLMHLLNNSQKYEIAYQSKLCNSINSKFWIQRNMRKIVKTIYSAIQKDIKLVKIINRKQNQKILWEMG